MSREEQMASVADMHGIGADMIPHDVPLVRFVTPREQLDVKADCLEREGFLSQREGDSIVLQIEPDQQLAYGIADVVCTRKFPIDLTYTKPLTDEQWVQIYEHLVEVTVPCIRDLGYEVSDPLTLETYLQSSPESRWNPIGDVEQQVTEDALSTGRWESFDEFQRACPASPEGLRDGR